MPSDGSSLSQWIGRYRYRFDAPMEAFWRARLAEQGLDVRAQEAAFAEIRAEAEGAEVEIGADGTIASRSRGQEFYRAPLSFEGETARFVKPTGVSVTVRLRGGGLTADEPGKPTMRFERE